MLFKKSKEKELIERWYSIGWVYDQTWRRYSSELLILMHLCDLRIVDMTQADLDIQKADDTNFVNYKLRGTRHQHERFQKLYQDKKHLKSFILQTQKD